MYVSLWNGEKIPVKDRDEAVGVIQAKLRGWMNEDDRLAWYLTPDDERLNRKPSQCIVNTEYGENTDAEAHIVYLDIPKGHPLMNPVVKKSRPKRHGRGCRAGRRAD